MKHKKEETEQNITEEHQTGTALVVQWIRFCTPNAGDLGSIPGQGSRSHIHATTKSSHATTKEPASCNQINE